MKILVVSQYYYPEPFRITDICETLVNRGHNVTVLTGQPNYPEGEIYAGYKNCYSFENINGVKIFRTKIHPRKKESMHLFLNYLSFPYYANKTLRKIDKDFDLVFINQLSPVFSAIPGLKYANKHKVKSYLYCLDLWPESLVTAGIHTESIIYKIFGKISNRLYNKANEVLVTSKSFVKKFEALGIKVKYLPQYAEDEFNTLPYYKKEEFKFQCTFAGNIGETQSVETIMYAANELKEHKDIIINIYGTGTKFAEIQSLKVSMKLDNVLIHGRKDLSEMPSIYAKSDALLVTMKKNALLSMTLPGKVQTYLASGKPIIGSIDGETKKVIQESGAGYVCEAEDYVTLSNLILEAKANPNLSTMGESGRRYCNEYYNKSTFFEQLEQIFKE